MRYVLFLILLWPFTLWAQSLPALIPYNDGHNKWGYADTSGRVIIAPRWDEAGFFEGNRAMVVTDGSASGRSFPGKTYCIIDQAGEYLLPPEAGWNGVWQGWRETDLNTTDSNGRHGLADTAGRILIPAEWDYGGWSPLSGPLADSFKVVSRKNRWGIVNRRGEAVLLMAGRLVAMHGQSPEDVLLVFGDTALNRYPRQLGLIDWQGRNLLPARFHEISFLDLRGQRTGVFAITQRFDSSSGKMRVVADTARYLFAQGMLEPANERSDFRQTDTAFVRVCCGYRRYFTDSGSGLADLDGKILIRHGIGFFSPDSLSVREERAIGSDTSLLIVQWLDTRTLRPLRPAKQWVLYREPPPPDRHEEAFSWHPRPYYEVPRIALRDAGLQWHIYKDSFLYTVTEGSRYALQSPGTIVHGNVKSHSDREYPTAYSAVLDSDLRYIVPPIRDFTIRGRDPRSGLVLAYGANAKYPTDGNALLDVKGRVLIHPIQQDLTGGFIWRGRPYAQVIETGYPEGVPIRIGDEESYAEITRTWYIDASRRPLPALAKYNVAAPGAFYDVLQEMPQGTIAVTNNTGSVGFVTPDGAIQRPLLSFRHAAIVALGNGWHLVRDQPDTTGVLIDAEGRVLLDGMRIWHAGPAPRTWRPYTNGQEIQAVIPGLYRVVQQYGAAKDTEFYLDRHGRAYRALPNAPAAKQKRR